MWNCGKGRLLAWEPSGIQGFIASCQFKVVDLLIRPRVVIGFVCLPGGIICSPRCGEASLHLDPECTDLVGTGQSPRLLFFRWLSCAEWWLLPFASLCLVPYFCYGIGSYGLHQISEFLLILASCVSFSPLSSSLSSPYFCSSYFPSSPSPWLLSSRAKDCIIYFLWFFFF